eukprot:TRINITY_DN13808_c0_g1_i1.p1 TRINITY_DN13808_c0_g1~~TRINITY_DN13808_c0_g1_i1.p1  ORF type:complete len:636 (-),score=108.19 TRINITY_DN13808_c0_g1_i1:401-2215(-)
MALAAKQALSWEPHVQVHSAVCTARSPGAVPTCTVSAAADARADAQAAGTWQDDVERIGWGRLLIRTPSSEPGMPAFAAGYLEGYLTAERVAQHFHNTYEGGKLANSPAGMRDFLAATDAWWNMSAQGADPKDEYWKTMRFIRDQLDGLVAGVNAGLGAGQRNFSRLDLLMLNSFWDLGDIVKAVSISHRVDFEMMAPAALALYTRQHSHCSSVIKLLPDGSELFAGHNTWFEYYHLLRVFKRYEFGSKTPIAMSSYPGMLSSSDDFYQVGHLVVMETTLPNYNNDLFRFVKPESLLFWIRAMAANQLATSGPEWMEVFKRHNSGTYNNMWMVVDYDKFTPREPLREGLLTVGEQIPGHFMYEDQTQTLSYGYWPSYNAALYPETARRIKQDVMERTKGNKFSYQMVERAQIFRRDQATIASDEDMQRVMRYNKFQVDPIAQQDSCSQLACRADLELEPTRRMAFGAIDAKYTSSAHNRKGQAVIVAGPTHDDQTVFDWSLAPELAATTPHAGQPPRFNFGWMVVASDLSARPWLTSAGVRSTWNLSTAWIAAIAGLAVVGLIVATVALARRRSVASMNFDSSPGKSMLSNATPGSEWLLSPSS